MDGCLNGHHQGIVIPWILGGYVGYRWVFFSVEVGGGKPSISRFV